VKLIKRSLVRLLSMAKLLKLKGYKRGSTE
jgi:hypothetical protein